MQVNWLQKEIAAGTAANHTPSTGRAKRSRTPIPLSLQARLLGVSRSRLYYQPRPPRAEGIALHRIDEIYTQYPFYGSRRISEQLQRDGWQINRKAVQRHMREMGLEAIYPAPNLSKRRQADQIYPYVLRGLAISRPNHVWGIDVRRFGIHAQSRRGRGY
jgi:putative transposase